MISQLPGGGNGLGRIAGEALPPDEVPRLDALLPIDNGRASGPGEDRQVGKVTHDTLSPINIYLMEGEGMGRPISVRIPRTSSDSPLCLPQSPIWSKNHRKLLHGAGAWGGE